MKRFILTSSLVILFTSVAVQAAAGDAVLERYIELALTQNPRIAMSDRNADAAEARIPQAGSLPDPMLGFGIKDLSADDPFLGSGEMTGRFVMLEQMFPFPGTLGAKKEMARRDYEMARAEAANERLTLTSEIAELYYKWADVRAAMELMERNKALMQQMAELAAAAYSVGMGAQSDVLQAQTQVTKIDVELAMLRQREKSLVADINICCNLPPDVITTPPLPLAYEPIHVPYDTLWGWIERDNPMIAASLAWRTAAETGVRMARKMTYPDFRVGVEYMRRGETMPENMISLQAGVSLPVFWKTKQSPLMHEKRAERASAFEQHQDVLNMTRFELTDMTAMAASLEEQIEYYRDAILPRAAQTLESARAGYTNGKVDFMTVLVSQMTLFDAERDKLARIAEYNTVWAKLFTMAARPLP
ncbi:TolC family protein [bacterium]|nr:TolC family protein [bacterium]MBU1983815.1 TolC family protein [bacterium]